MRPHCLTLALSLDVVACGRGAPKPSVPPLPPQPQTSSDLGDGGGAREVRNESGEPPRAAERTDVDAGRHDPWECASHLFAQTGVRFTLTHVTRHVPSLDISFPQLADRDGMSVRPINAAIRGFVDTEVREYLADLKYLDDTGADAGPPDLKGYCKQWPVSCYCKADCVPTWVSSQLTSVACTKSCGGGAYPNTGWWTLVLDTTHPAAPRPVRLDELVPPETRDDFWRALDVAVRKNAACMGETSWDSPVDEEGLGDLSFYVTPDALVVLAPLPHVSLAFAECAFRRTSPIAWLRPGIAW
jgi:hypothetical protein